MASLVVTQDVYNVARTVEFMIMNLYFYVILESENFP